VSHKLKFSQTQTNATSSIHQPLHAVMVLVRDVNRFPNSPHSEANIQAIDEALALCDPDGGITGIREGRLNRRSLKQGGQEAWNLIRKLRAQAWRKVGLDPDVFLTRSETEERVRQRLTNQGFTGRWSTVPEFNLLDEMDLTLDDELMGELELASLANADIDWFQWE
jgi:hypothetical protein